MKIIGYIFTTILLWVYGYVLHGWVLTKLWAWFIVPTFALPALSLPAAIGVSVVVGFLTTHLSHADMAATPNTYIQSLITAFVFTTCTALLSLIGGWIVQMWM